MYEDEEGRIQDSLELLWLKLDELQRGALAWHIQFLQITAEFSSRIHDRIFGYRILSLRALGVSSSLSFTSLGVLLLLFLLKAKFEGQIIPAMQLWGEEFWLGFAALFSAISAGLAVIGIRSRTKWQYLSLLPLVLTGMPLAAAIVWWIVGRYAVEDLEAASRIWLAFAAGLMAAICANAGLIALVRMLVRWTANSASIVRVLLMLSSNALIVAFIGLLYHTPSLPLPPQVQQMLAGLFFMSGPILIAAACMFFFAALMLLHRMLWPLLQRPLYSLARIGVVRRRRLCGAIGIGLLALALGEGTASVIGKLIAGLQ